MKITIASGKGGTGKTMVSTNFFAWMSGIHPDVVLVDCDAEEPNAGIFFLKEQMGKKIVRQQVPQIEEGNCTFCNDCHDVCKYHAIFSLPDLKVIQVINDLCHDCGACYHMCNYNAIHPISKDVGTVTKFITKQGYQFIEARTIPGVYSPVKIIDEAIKLSEERTLSLFDAPPGTSCSFIHTVSQSDLVLMVAEPTPFGVSDLKKAVAVVKDLNVPFGVIVNKDGLGNDDLFQFLENEKIDLLARIPFDLEIAKMYSQGRLLINDFKEFDTIFQSIHDFIKLHHGVNSY
jgi:MinD superfamily P-loop ATPase